MGMNWKLDEFSKLTMFYMGARCDTANMNDIWNMKYSHWNEKRKTL